MISRWRFVMYMRGLSAQVRVKLLPRLLRSPRWLREWRGERVDQNRVIDYKVK